MEVLYTLAVPAIVKFVQLLNEKQWQKSLWIVLAVLAGGVLGYVSGGTAGIPEGLVLGLSGSGLVTVSGYAGKKIGETVKETP